MNLKFHHRGKQFFFLTLCVEGRRPLFSRLVEGTRRPLLTAAGECVKALWLAVHRLNPALAASDYVIMPDHVHLLLIADYARDRDFKPLVFMHWFMEESERMIAALAGGEAMDGELCPPHPPAEEVLARLLPTTMRATYKIPPIPLGGAGSSPSFARGAGSSPSFARGAGDIPSPLHPPPLWEPRHLWLDLSFSSRQLAAIRRYIRNNPARALWKRNHPDLFALHRNFRHPVLDPALPWTAIGDLTLLANPFMEAVSFTRKKSVAEHEPAIARLVEAATRGCVVVCGFLSPGEKELERRLKATPGTRWIKTMAQGLPPRFDPTVEDSRYLAEHRQLLLSALPVGAPFDWTTCHTMNAHAAALCARARGEIETIPLGGAGSSPSLARGSGFSPSLAKGETNDNHDRL